MHDDKFRQLIKKNLLERNWSDLASQWTNFIPVIDPVGSPPDPSLSEFLGFQDVAKRMIERGDSTARESVDGLRETIFREAIFLLHKASHAIGCAEVAARAGAQTWSLCGAYQGALFGAKAIVYLLGVGLPEYKSKLVMTDAWPKRQNERTSQNRRRLAPEDNGPLQFTTAAVQMGHQHFWLVFQRLLNVSKVEVWHPEYLVALRKLQVKEFASQRNIVHNRDGRWILGDLHEFVVDERFGVHEVDLHKALIYVESSDFSIALALAILRMGFSLIDSLTEATNKLNAELGLMKNRLTQQYHPLYVASNL